MPASPAVNAELRAACTRVLSLHRPLDPRAWFQRLAASPYAAMNIDQYGQGEAVQLLEGRVAALLGKPAAVFVPKGTVAQMAALRVHTDRRAARTVALHPLSHIELDEDGAVERLHHLTPVRVGTMTVPFTCADLAPVRERLGALVIELPLRRAAFQLPEWTALVDLHAWAAERGVPLHLDGARLWSSAPSYGRTYSDIAALADSVYVSLYKDVGGLGGCVLAGQEDFIDEVRPWLARHGSLMYRSFPLVVSALDGLDRHLPRMTSYVSRAQALAAQLAGVDGVRIRPGVPHTSGFQVLLEGDPDRLRQAADDLAREQSVWLFSEVRFTEVPGISMIEIQVGDAAEDFTDEEIAGFFREVMRGARAASGSQEPFLKSSQEDRVPGE
ncbi:threonine aldolase family protein [Deinococcus deserti]|uniref:Putative threonine aldolase n=1 Tax=Deinococcus deserti (strain DSM 17065 / CIP 109153 / LMG 22923 / VCD115) TaxID=546414 RepID=C1D2A0_DEIDV|nr:beta-eliminating lyase-related protein [Deinococcus deserti]ACO47539.2 putative threonine aldolase [Deinococcus deserti VCD115]